MATIKICDALRRPFKPGETAYSLVLNGSTYEICEEAFQKFNAILGGEPAVEQEVVSTPATVNPLAGLLDVPVKGDPFAPTDSKPTAEVNAPLVIDVPDDIRKRFKTPTAEVQEEVVRQATRFPEGTLPALTPGKRRKEAAKALAEIEAQREQAMRGNAERHGINVNDNWKKMGG